MWLVVNATYALLLVFLLARTKLYLDKVNLERYVCFDHRLLPKIFNNLELSKTVINNKPAINTENT